MDGGGALCHFAPLSQSGTGKCGLRRLCYFTNRSPVCISTKTVSEAGAWGVAGSFRRLVFPPAARRGVALLGRGNYHPDTRDSRVSTCHRFPRCAQVAYLIFTSGHPSHW